MRHDGKRLARAAGALALVAGLAWFAACASDTSGPCTTCPPPDNGVIVSNPVPSPSMAVGTMGAPALANGAAGTVAYVSLAPGTVPAGRLASVQRVGDAVSLTTPVTDGGFDPVPVTANVGDSIVVTVTDAGGTTRFQARVAVIGDRPPIIVRTDPPPRKRDVPLNASIVIVFSEPIDPASLTTSFIQLVKGGTPIPGSVRFVDAGGIVAAFDPAAALDPSSDYQLVVTTGVRDRGGRPLAAEDNVTFTTGTVTLAPVSTVRILADTMATFPSVGSSWQLVAVATDANNSVIVGRPVTWVSQDVTVATVSATGLLKAIAPGTTQIVATVDGVPSLPKYVSVQ